MKSSASAPLDEAILRTLLYADIFDYALTPREIHYYLTGLPAAPEAVEQALADSPWLAERLECAPGGLVTLRGRGSLAARREARRQASARLWEQARLWSGLIAGLPFVRLTAVTGALAVDNSGPGDDIDLLIAAAPGRVWLARAFTIAVVRLARLAGAGLCPNYVLSTGALVLDQRDLYVAHDLAQMAPLAGHAVYAEMRALNRWAEAYLPQAAPFGLRREADRAPRGLARRLQRLAEWLLSGRLGQALEDWERERKLLRFEAAARRPGSAARLDRERIQGHFDDHGRIILQHYQARLVRHGLAAEEEQPA